MIKEDLSLSEAGLKTQDTVMILITKQSNSQSTHPIVQSVKKLLTQNDGYDDGEEEIGLIDDDGLFGPEYEVADEVEEDIDNFLSDPNYRNLRNALRSVELTSVDENTLELIRDDYPDLYNALKESPELVTEFLNDVVNTPEDDDDEGDDNEDHPGNTNNDAEGDWVDVDENQAEEDNWVDVEEIQTPELTETETNQLAEVI